MIKTIVLAAGVCVSALTFSQQNDSTEWKRTGFAKAYFELGGTYMPSFEGKVLLNNEVSSYNNVASGQLYLNWGGFHFHGHTEFYVTIPLFHKSFSQNDGMDFRLTHSVATGARFFPWKYKQNSIRPYIGVGWSGLDFKQIDLSESVDYTSLSKDFSISLDAGVVFGYKQFSARIAGLYFPDNKWQYPISKTQKALVKTPYFGLQVGFMYAMDWSSSTSKEVSEEDLETWNSYPTLSKQGTGKEKFGDVFIGAGPSMSFSLKPSTHNKEDFPYLKDKMSSNSYFDIAIGYQFNRIGLFTAVSFRNPKFSTAGFGTTQKITKTSFVLEVNKLLFDYTGFTPYVGLNIGYDKLSYSITDQDITETSEFKRFEPGVTFGWDIRPGKNQESFVLRTNLRWMPFSNFTVNSKKFEFNQLEYNLIQLVFFPERFIQKRKMRH